jgi:hypothetical protein
MKWIKCDECYYNLEVYEKFAIVKGDNGDSEIFGYCKGDWDYFSRFETLELAEIFLDNILSGKKSI